MSLLVTNLTLFYGILTQMSGVEDDGFSSDGSAQVAVTDMLLGTIECATIIVNQTFYYNIVSKNKEAQLTRVKRFVVCRLAIRQRAIDDLPPLTLAQTNQDDLA